MSGCTCPPYAQRWTFDEPGRCRTCGQPFVPYSVARECHGEFECGGTCPKHRAADTRDGPAG